jgi:hypothetical protein
VKFNKIMLVSGKMDPSEVLQSCGLSYCSFILSYDSKSDHGLKYLKHTGT